MAPTTRTAARLQGTTAVESLSDEPIRKSVRLKARRDAGIRRTSPERKLPGKKWKGGGWWAEVPNEKVKEPRETNPRPEKKRKLAKGDAEDATPNNALRRSPRVAKNKRRKISLGSSTGDQAALLVEATESQDEVFLRETTTQLNDLLESAVKGQDIYRRNLYTVMPFLENMTVPATSNIQEENNLHSSAETHLYLLDNLEAHRLLNSSQEVHAPVLVHNGAKQIFIPEIDNRRPIEQVFDYFHNPHESDESTTDRKSFTIDELRARFLSPSSPSSSSPSNYPSNFPDIINPLLDNGIPPFVQSPSTNLLRSIARIFLSVIPTEICPDSCPNHELASLKCSEHKLNTDELFHFQSGWLYWQSTMMLAEPGAMTLAHWDKWGFGTWIACYEGEIAFAWLVDRNRSERQLIRWFRERVTYEARSRWVFAVLRAGDALYMPPGTVHLVFRRPESGPTLALAGHLVRYGDVLKWLRALREEVRQDVRRPDEDTPYAEMAACLVAGMREIIGREDLAEREIERYGGREVVDDAMTLLQEIEKEVGRLR